MIKSSGKLKRLNHLKTKQPMWEVYRLSGISFIASSLTKTLFLLDSMMFARIFSYMAYLMTAHCAMLNVDARGILCLKNLKSNTYFTRWDKEIRWKDIKARLIFHINFEMNYAQFNEFSQKLLQYLWFRLNRFRSFFLFYSSPK